MERNRRIGKAYARVPIVTIDGSHELSYDGYKLALNGFDNHDRDAKTEECRKRIGKGIRIKMDHFGNILIKRLSKSSVYIKEWLQPVSTSGSSHGGRSSQLMPSRQQLIKNQNALLAASMSGGGVGGVGRAGSQVSAFGVSASVTPSSSSSGSSMEPPNDSAVCDEVISVGGRLEQDKIYVMFDMKKFQANITQELCRAYPDKRKLEQQCFSIVGLARDADEILNLPCWVMVINIVAIEMLNERFPLMSHHHTSFPDTMLLDPSAGNRRANQIQSAPNFVSIFEQNNNGQHHNHHHNHHQIRQSCKDDQVNKEEDPYSLPANASSSDLKSSINDYGTTSTKNIGSLMDSNSHVNNCSSSSSSRYYGSKRAEMYAHKKELASRKPPLNGAPDAPSPGTLLADLKQRSKSNCNIHGLPGNKLNGNHLSNSRYNNSSSIYSPGHMLVPPPGDSVPPKLPPRDFVKKTKSKSSSNVSYDASSATIAANMDPNNECIYSTGHMTINNETTGQQANKVARKTKKNRFLESLKAPLELAKSSSNRSASVMGAPINQQSDNLVTTSVDKKASSKSRNPGKSSATKNLKSFLSSSKNISGFKTTKQDINNSDEKAFKGATKLTSQTHNKKQPVDNNGEVDSVVDSTEEIGDDNQQQVAQTTNGSSASASYNDLDIPTPDYETDENIYALDTNYRGFSPPSEQLNKDKNSSNRRLGVNSLGGNNMTSKKHNREDLYYSGYRAHVPNQHVANGGLSSSSSNGKAPNIHDPTNDKITRESSRFVSHNLNPNNNNNNNNSKMLAPSSNNHQAKLNGRDMIYGSTTGLSAASMIGSRYRSASMQRYYPRGSSQVARSQTEMYDLDSENLYAMSAGIHNANNLDNLIQTGSQYGGLMTNGASHRRRSISKLAMNHPFGATGGGPPSGGNLHRITSSMANSNYDIGRSSSGIYGNNSSSSSSDYADWHPQMRKVNSSGYLNSIFKSHMASASSPIDLFNTNHALNNNHLITGGGIYNNGKHHVKQARNYATSRILKSSPPISALTKQQQQQQQQTHHQVASSMVNGPSYPSYDSSNGKYLDR